MLPCEVQCVLTELVVILFLLWNTGCRLTGAAWSHGQGSDPMSPVRFFGGCGWWGGCEVWAHSFHHSAPVSPALIDNVWDRFAVQPVGTWLCCSAAFCPCIARVRAGSCALPCAPVPGHPWWPSPQHQALCASTSAEVEGQPLQVLGWAGNWFCTSCSLDTVWEESRDAYISLV